MDDLRAEAPGKRYRVGPVTFERGGRRWGATAHDRGYGVSGYRTPVGAAVALWRWLREMDREWQRRHGGPCG